MPGSAIEADYVVIGAGAAGMAFIDTLLDHSQATVAIIDANHGPGGHWNHAYPFVRLHLPSYHYGVASRELGDRSIARGGLNDGLLSMASGVDVVSYFQSVMERTFLPTGRVAYFPMTQFDWVGQAATSLISGERRAVKARRKFVDATYAATEIPGAHSRNFGVDEGVRCIAVSDLVKVCGQTGGYCMIGGGKTAIDACLWLLENGVDARRIKWIVPRDAWWIDRSKVQFTPEFFETSFTFIADQLEAMGEATSIDDIFLRFEQRGLWFRLDRSITPTMFHGATISRAELEKLQSIKDVVRKGRIRQIQRDRIVLDAGSVPANDDLLYVDCSAAGIPPRQPTTIFEPEKITLQWIKWGLQSFSAALLGYVEATIDSDELKNELCQAMSPPRAPVDWLRNFVATLQNQRRWSSQPHLAKWAHSTRLDMAAKVASEVSPDDAGRMALLQRVRKAGQAAVPNAMRLLDGR